MESDQFKVIIEPSRVIENVLDNQPRVDDVGRIPRLARIAAGNSIRIEHTSTHAKRVGGSCET